MSARVIYVISGSKDIVAVVNVVDDKLNVMGVAQGSIWGDKLPAIAVVVRVGLVEDNKALRCRVVCSELSKVQISIQRVGLRSGGVSINHDWLR